MAPPGGTERQTHSQRSRTADRPVQVAATACSTGQGRNVASPAWLEKQPCPQPPAAGAQRSAPGAQRSAAGTQSSAPGAQRSEEHTSELQSRGQLVCRLLLEKKKHRTNMKETS